MVWTGTWSVQVFRGRRVNGMIACVHGEALLRLQSSGSAELGAQGWPSGRCPLPTHGGPLGGLLSPLGPPFPVAQRPSWGRVEDETGSGGAYV